MDTTLYLLSDDIEHPFKDGHLVIGHTRDEDLLDGRLRFSGSLTEAVGVCGDRAQVHEL